jgi:hypothetical protein
MTTHLQDHFQRVREGVESVYNLGNLSSWISKYTKLEGKDFSYIGHEYQKEIIDDPAKDVYSQKCAQTGLSEIFMRWGMSACATQDNFTLIWTFPSSSDAERFAKARIDPMIASSREMQRALSKIVNSSELKQFGMNSFCYIRGTLSDTGGLSVPADLLIHDEYDKSDMDNISTYVSRLQHKPTKMRRIFSTPTIAKYGISLLMETAKRKHQMWKCSHCNHQWVPSYELDVDIPGWDGEKKLIDKYNLKNIRWSEARLLCPSCKCVPDSDIKYREWVVENPLDNYDASGWMVSPFCAPKFISPSYLVKVSTEFNKWPEFVNQSLGLTSEDESESLTETDIRKSVLNAELVDSGTHSFGADMGVLCHIAIGRKASDGTYLVVHREKVSYNKFEERRRELMREYRCATSVHDAFPYSDIVKRITDFDPNAYGAIYADSNNPETYKIREQEGDDELGKLNFRSLIINRSIAFDWLMNLMKKSKLFIKDQGDIEDLVLQFRDMKRVQEFDKHGGIVYRWKKTQGLDHYHHATLYMLMAIELRGTATNLETQGLPQLISRFKVVDRPRTDHLR